MSTLKALRISGETVLTFNSDNRWVDTGLSRATLVDQNFIDLGFDPDILSTNLTTINMNFIDSGELGTDGQHLWISEDIDKNLGTTAMSYIDNDTQPKLQLTLPSFLPKDSLISGDYILVYSADTSYVPEILSTSFSAITTHSSSIQLTFTPRYQYSKQIVYRITVNGVAGAWSEAQNPYSDITAIISASNLQLGTNDILLEVADSADATKVGTKSIPGAITQSDAVPTINIVTAESDSFKCHFIISDTDAGDTGKYQLSISNSSGTKVLVPWTTLSSMPLDVSYQFNSSDIVANSTNILKIEFADNYGKSSSATYSFTGQYKNVLFVDENGGYYSTDKGLDLKVLNFGKLISGRTSTVKKVSLQNNNPYDVGSIVISKSDTSNITESYIELSKVSNPFTPLDELDFGDLTLKYKEKADFYVRIRTGSKAQGIDNFKINAVTI